MPEKKVPNPYGKLGSPQHQDKVDEVAEDIENRGLAYVKELFLRLLNGRGKFVDVAAFDNQQKLHELHQIGKQNKNGLPVKRERDTIDEIYKNMGIKPEFHSYNNNESVEQEKYREN